MTLEPLLKAAPIIQVHAFAAMGAFALGLVQFAAPKGTLPHRTIGWIWVALMATIAISSFWIHQIRIIGTVQPDPFPVHLHAGDASIFCAARAPASRAATSQGDDLDLRRRC
jgi:uncharacterized membrane protein